MNKKRSCGDVWCPDCEAYTSLLQSEGLAEFSVRLRMSPNNAMRCVRVRMTIAKEEFEACFVMLVLPTNPAQVFLSRGSFKIQCKSCNSFLDVYFPTRPTLECSSFCRWGRLESIENCTSLLTFAKKVYDHSFPNTPLTCESCRAIVST